MSLNPVSTITINLVLNDVLRGDNTKKGIDSAGLGASPQTGEDRYGSDFEETQTKPQAPSNPVGNTTGGLAGKLGQAVQGLKGQTIRGNEPNCAYTVMEAYDRAGGKGFAKNMGLNSYVPTAYDSMKSSGKWQALKLTPGVKIPAGAVGFSERFGHMVVASADGKFYGANESGRKSLGKSWYQPENRNLDAVLVPKDISV